MVVGDYLYVNKAGWVCRWKPNADVFASISHSQIRFRVEE